MKSKGLTNAGRFWNTNETPMVLIVDLWVVGLCVGLGGIRKKLTTFIHI